MELREHSLDVVGDIPLRVVVAERLEVGDPPAVIAHPVLTGKLPVQLTVGDPLAHVYRLEHRAVALPPPTDVVDGRRARGPVESVERSDEVGGVDVVSHLLA